MEEPKDKPEWIGIRKWEEGYPGLENYAVFDKGFDGETEFKSSPTKEDLDILEKYLNEQMETISFLRDKYNLN